MIFASIPVVTRSTVAIALALALLSWQFGCAAGAIGLPPSRTDVASRVSMGNGHTSRATRISSGVHWASATTTRNVGFDVGGGVIYERSDALDPGVENPSAPTDTTPPKSAPLAVRQGLGGYLEAAKRIASGPISRTWLGARAEVVRDMDTHRIAMSLTGRVSWEVYAGGKGAGAGGGSKAFGMAIGGGTFGIGPYVESGLRQSPDSGAEFLLSAGISIRMPGFLAFGVGFK